MTTMRVFGKAQQSVQRSLRWSERYTKTDMGYLTGNGAWLVVAQVTIALIALGLSIAFARYVPKDTYGTYRFLLSLFWTLTALSLTGIPIILSRAVARGKDATWMQAVRLSLTWSWPMVLASLCLSFYYYLSGNLLLAAGALVIAVIGPLMQPAYLFGPYLTGKKRFRDNAFSGIALNLLPALALLASIFLTKNPLVYLTVYLTASVCTAAALSMFIYLRDQTKTAGTEDELFVLGGHYSAMKILNTVASQIDRILVYHYLGAVELAVYAFATAMPDQIKNVFSNIATLALPKFANRSLTEIKRTLTYRLIGFTLLVASAALLYLLVAPMIFQYLFPAYHEAVFYSQLYALALIPIGGMFPETLLQAHAAKKALYIFNVGGSAFQIASIFVGIAFFGLVGAIVARIASRTFNLVLGIAVVNFMSDATEPTNI